MKKTITALFATAALAMGFAAHAAESVLIKEDIGVEVPVEMVVPATITQVVATDGHNTFVMATEQKVETLVQVTPEMANTAQLFSIANDKLPEIYSVGQAANNGESEPSNTPFTKLGMIEPIAVSKTVVNTVFFKYGNQNYSFETTGEVGNTVTLSHELIAKSTKL